MSREQWRSFLRVVIIAAGAAVVLASLASFRLDHWPIYVVYFLLAGILILPAVDVLPGLLLPIPGLAVTIGFLYIAGPPIILLRMLAPVMTLALRALLPRRWRERLPELRADALASRREPVADALMAGRAYASTFAEWGAFAIGMGVRLWMVSVMQSPSYPITDPATIVVAELVGYVVWGLVAILPLYPDRPLFPLTSPGGMGTAMQDLGLIVNLALTPFVFLISYGYRVHGLVGAAVWSFATLGLHVVLKRLSDRRRAIEEQNRRLELLNRELEHRERLSAIGKMSSVVSHQILHQLGVIGIYADLVRHVEADGDVRAALDQVRSYGGAIEDALGDVNRVLTDLLVFSRDLKLNLYAHPLPRVIEESVESTRAEAAERGVTIRVDPVPAVEITLDKLKITQAIVNVIRNAVEVSPAGSTIVVHVDDAGDAVDLLVSDKGPGVPEKDREAIFTPFFTTKPHGTGLGLAIAREFTEAHGGRLTVEPSETGATFRIHLPRQPVASRTLDA